MVNYRKLFYTMVLLLLTSAALTAQVRDPITEGETRLKLFAKHLELKENAQFSINDSTTIADLEWQFIGPTNMSGRCVDVDVVAHENGSFTMYIASASGGVWRSSNEGITWQPIFFDQSPATSIGDVAVAPSDANVVWVGTGEANIFRSSMAGVGLYKSTDGGDSWQHRGLSNTFTIARIVIHPRNPDIVYVAASGHEYTNNPERGVYKTADGGNTWSKVLFVDDKTGTIDLVMDPNDSDLLYAATWQRIRKKWNDPRNEPDYTGSSIFKTTDGGANWTPINDGLPEAQYRGRIGIDIARSNPKVIYAFIDNYESTTGNRIKGATVYRSDNGGQSWTQKSGQTPAMQRYMSSHSGTYGWVFGQMRVDPNDENTVYTMGLRLNVSTDGGETIRSVGGTGHVDHHALWINPRNSDHMITCNDGGTAITYDKGENWRLLHDGITVTQFYNVGIDMDTPFRVYGSLQDQGSVRGVVDISNGRDAIRAVAFESAPGGEASRHAIDPTDPNIVYSEGFYGSINRTDYNRPSERRSYTSESIMPKTSAGDPELRGQWLAPFIISPHHPDVIYHGMQYLFKSVYRGITFERISPDLTNNDPDKMGDIPYQTIWAISESPFQSGLIYVGTDDGNVHLTKDGGKSWAKIDKGIQKDRFVSRLVASQYDRATVYMTLNGKRDDDFTPYVYKSTDYGKTWVDIAGNIPFGPVNVIREDPRNANILYLGTDVGVYVTRDGGAHWDVLGDLPSVYVHDLKIHPRDNILVIATHGRGMWAMDANPINSPRRGRRR